MMKRLLVGIIFLACSTGVAFADVMIEWNNVTMEAIRSDLDKAYPTIASRECAMVHGAIFDAINAIDQKRKPIALKNYRAPAGASRKAAVSQAAYRVLAHLYPELEPVFKDELKRHLSKIKSRKAKKKGIKVGNRAAEAMINWRRNDGSADEVPYTQGTEPGEWRRTPPDFLVELTPHWPFVDPFVLKKGNQYRPSSPPSLRSRAYAKDYKFIKQMGAADSPIRTEEQSKIAWFWTYDQDGTRPPIILYNEVLQQITLDHDLKLYENCYLFALANIAMADAAIAAWDGKYYYNLWRPVTGIQEGDHDTNRRTKGDPDWFPLGPPGGIIHKSPHFPTYPSGHSTFGMALACVLKYFYGTDKMTFTVKSVETPGFTRTFKRFSAMADENGISRVYLGVHWTYDNDAGLMLGKKVGKYVCSNVMQECPPKK